MRRGIRAAEDSRATPGLATGGVLSGEGWWQGQPYQVETSDIMPRYGDGPGADGDYVHRYLEEQVAEAVAKAHEAESQQKGKRP